MLLSEMFEIKRKDAFTVKELTRGNYKMFLPEECLGAVTY